ncbi:hypothetical protein, partial [Rubrivirga sp.]|uniref:hypothetical protein n=1 Tax=Rubrivirga sp. TaxID=1885344 RepID=UPI003C725743
DSAGTDLEDDGPPPPASATVTVDLASIRAVRDCDSGDNPGDFHFRVSFVDGRNQSIGSVVEIPAGRYGSDGTEANTIQLDDGESFPLNESVSFTLPEQDGSAFTVQFMMIEWESATARDAQADDASRLGTYEFVDGRFRNIAGSQALVINPTSRTCQTRLEYSITVG